MVCSSEPSGNRRSPRDLPLGPSLPRHPPLQGDGCGFSSLWVTQPIQPHQTSRVSGPTYTHGCTHTEKCNHEKKKMLSGCSYVCVVIICSLRCAKASQPRHHVHSTASTCLFLMACCCNFCWRIPKVSDALSLEYIDIHTHTLVWVCVLTSVVLQNNRKELQWLKCN